VLGPRSVRVAVRDLRTLDVVRSAVLPIRPRRFDSGRNHPLHCADADGTAHVAVGDYIRRTRFERMRIFRLDAAGLRRVTTLEGSTAALGSGTAYIGRYGEAIFAVDLGTGAARRLTAVRGPEPMAVSPDGARLAFYDSERLRVLDVATGQERSRRIGYGHAIEWIDPQRLLFRNAGAALAFDTELRRLRRYPFVRMYGQAHVSGRVYGSARYRLRALDLETGRKLGVASLTDRGIVDLAGVAEQPFIEPGRRRPKSPPASGPVTAASRCAN
jgi:hypothetical protein